MYSIGNEIKKIRHVNKLSQEEFADKMNKKLGLSITKGMISKWESDLIEPKTRMIKAIAETFHVSLDQILGLQEQQKSTTYETIAAHMDEDLTEDEIEDIKKYIKFIKSQRK